jgi:hypothetical protein
LNLPLGIGPGDVHKREKDQTFAKDLYLEVNELESEKVGSA